MFVERFLSGGPAFRALLLLGLSRSRSLFVRRSFGLWRASNFSIFNKLQVTFLYQIVASELCRRKLSVNDHLAYAASSYTQLLRRLLGGKESLHVVRYLS